jgi:molybdopterin-synthase adenylyltransferase
MDRYDRNIRFFGAAGQERLAALRVVIVGIGGLGTHVIQQLALLGCRNFTLIDHELLDWTNLNRYIGVTASDVGQPKVALGARLAQALNPSATVTTIQDYLQSAAAFTAIRGADIVIACLDTDGARLVCTEVCAAAGVMYVDLATDIIPDAGALSYGGRVAVSFIGDGCVVCRGLLDLDAARRDLDPRGALAQEAIYGVPAAALGSATGPAVVSLNGVVASLAATEVMLHVTGVRPAQPVLTYRGETGKVLANADVPARDCYYCAGTLGRWELAGVERYLVMC